ncbi:MAG TPA: isocitrate/isopropylmalate family dehydrogenase, partial [Rhodanobacteraceae bacterium]
AVHGSAPDIAGKNVADPCALLLAAAEMLDHLGMVENGTRIRSAIRATLAAHDRVTPDLGGNGTTVTFADALAGRVGS